MSSKKTLTEDIPKCENCRYWKDETEANDPAKLGLCRRYPAQVLYDGDGAFGLQPTTEHDEWCGEYERLLQ